MLRRHTAARMQRAPAARSALQPPRRLAAATRVETCRMGIYSGPATVIAARPPPAHAAACPRQRPPGRLIRLSTHAYDASGGALVSVDYWRWQRASSADLWKQGWFRRLVLGATGTLTLGTMGGAFLPLPAVFASTGLSTGLLLCATVALTNIYTTRMLLKQALLTGAPDYEGLGFQIGGTVWRRITEGSIFLLLWTSVVGQILQAGEVAAAALALQGVAPPPAPLLMGGLTCALALPWCFVREMKQLEGTAVVGYPVVLLLAHIIAARCVTEGFPAIASGALPTVASSDAVGKSVSMLGFAFFCQPLAMSALHEMPAGRLGVKVVGKAVQGVLLGTALVPYVMMGLFGAALWGQEACATGNLLQNSIFGASPAAMQAQAAINFCTAGYLCVSIPLLTYCCAHTMESWLDSVARRFSRLSWLAPSGAIGAARDAKGAAVHCCCLLSALVAAMLMAGGNSSALIALTGASGVLLVSYILPVVNHFALYFHMARCQDRNINRAQDLQVLYARVRRSPYSMLSLDDATAASVTMDAATGVGPPPEGLNRQDMDLFLLQRYDRSTPPLYNDPRKYRTQGRRAAMFLVDVLLPIVVAAFGIATSACMLLSMM